MKKNLIRIALLLILLLGLLFGMPRYFPGEERPQIETVALDADAPEDVPNGYANLRFTGLSLFRVNKLFIDEKPIPIVYHATQNYETCWLVIRPEDLPSGPAKIRVAKSYPITLFPVYFSNTLRLDF